MRDGVIAKRFVIPGRFHRCSSPGASTVVHPRALPPLFIPGSFHRCHPRVLPPLSSPGPSTVVTPGSFHRCSSPGPSTFVIPESFYRGSGFTSFPPTAGSVCKISPAVGEKQRRREFKTISPIRDFGDDKRETSGMTKESLRG